MSTPGDPGVQAVLLAAGSGTRMGLPKALLRDASGRSLVQIQVEKLQRAAELSPVAAGADPLNAEAAAAPAERSGRRGAGLGPEPIVVVGARSAEVAALVPAGVRIVQSPDWQRGMGESLATGLRAVCADAVAVLVMLVDLVDVPAEVIARMSSHAAPDALARAAWRGTPGHPVLIGRDRIPEAIAACHDDVGARALFAGADRAGKPATLVECGDLVTPGRDGAFDVDTPDQAASRGLHLEEAPS